MMKASSPAALVIGLEVNGYGIVRSLAREGVATVGVHSSELAFGRFSRYCDKRYLDPSIHEEEQICEALMAWGGRLDQKAVLFPTSDRYVMLLARHREELSGHFLFHWVDPKYLSGIVNKDEIALICRQAGIVAPMTHVPKLGEDLGETAKEFPFPCIVKPVRSFNTGFPTGVKNFVAHSLKELLDFYNDKPGLMGETIWQQIVEGGDENLFTCTALVRRSGEIGPTFCARKIRQYPPGFGSMCFGRSEWNEVVVSEALKLLRFLGHSGFGSLEFKYQPADGRFYFIEMNPRLPWYSMLFADASVNLPYLCYADLTGKAEVCMLKPRQQEGVHWVSLEREMGWLFRTRGRRPISLLTWLSSITRARSFAWWNPRDPKPFAAATFDLIKSGILKLVTHALAALKGSDRENLFTLR